MKEIKDINTETPEGRYLMAAISQLCLLQDKTPNEVLEFLSPIVERMYEPVLN